MAIYPEQYKVTTDAPDNAVPNIVTKEVQQLADNLIENYYRNMNYHAKEIASLGNRIEVLRRNPEAALLTQ